MDVLEIDPNFEPQSRARSNTWPLRPKEVKKEPDEPTRSPTIDENSTDTINKDPLGLNSGKKSGSRRNAWGNLSYADLITKAIQSSPEKRLTLSQIYDWMVHNVPYFKDKGDSNSSAGWKNSIRHNLSLHNRFMRIQNEGTGKSSWWVINPDAKPGKAPRRRATSMDTKAYEKKRGRAKRKAEQLRAAMAEGHSPSHTGSQDFCENGLIPEDSPLGSFNLSPGDFRGRTSSNASSIGRLSPIQSAHEPDLHDNQVPPMSPLPWQTGGLDSTYSAQDGYAETLTESLAEMFVGENDMVALSPVENRMALRSNMSTPSPVPQPQLSPSNSGSVGGSVGFQGGGLLQPPPPYPDHLRHSSQQQQSQPSAPVQCSNMASPCPISLPQNSVNFSPPSNTMGSQTCDPGSTMSSNFMSQSVDLLQNDMYQEPVLEQDPMMGEPPCTTAPTAPLNQYNGINNCSALAGGQLLRPMCQQQPPLSQAALLQQQQLQQARKQQLLQMLRSQPSESLLKQALSQRTQLVLRQQQLLKAQKAAAQQELLSQLQQQQQQEQHQCQLQQQPDPFNSFCAGNPNSLDTMAFPSSLAGFPSDLDVNFSEMEADDIACDVEQIIKHELDVDGNLDFNFDQIQATISSGGDILQLSH